MKVFVMLIWAGLASGGPTTLPIFKTQVACERAIVKLTDDKKTPWWGTRAICVELDTE